jgi:hypothetical protein
MLKNFTMAQLAEETYREFNLIQNLEEKIQTQEEIEKEGLKCT